MMSSGIFFPAVSEDGAFQGVAVEGVLTSFEKDIVGNATLKVINCKETISAVYDAFSAAVSVGLLDSLNYTYNFSEKSIAQLQSGKYCLTGDSLSVSVFISLIFTCLGKKPNQSIAATGAIHYVNSEFVCNPVEMVEKKIELVQRSNIRRLYLPESSLIACPNINRTQIELIPIPSDISKVIDIVVQKESIR